MACQLSMHWATPQAWLAKQYQLQHFLRKSIQLNWDKIDYKIKVNILAINIFKVDIYNFSQIYFVLFIFQKNIKETTFV